MMTELNKDVYGQQIEKPVMGIKDYIRYFDKVRGTMTGTPRSNIEDRDASYDSINSSNSDDTIFSNNGITKETDKAKSKIEILKEQIFKDEGQHYKDESRMEEVEKLCKFRNKEEDKNKTEEDNIDIEKEINVESYVSSSLSIHQSYDDNSLLRDLDSLDTNEFMEFDEKLNEKIEEMNMTDTMIETEPIKEDSETMEVITKDIATDPVLKEDLRSHVSILKEEIEAQFKERAEPVETATVPNLPNSREIASDFRNFRTRPALFKCPPLSSSFQVTSMNLFTKCLNEEYSNTTLADMLTVTVPLFSKADLCSQKHVFRAPGGIISTRPTLRLHSSILTEQGILYYFNVSNENQSSWFIRKDLGNCKDVSTTVNRLNGLPDSEFNRFIVSDVVSIVFRRTSYIYYNNRIMILRLMESSLCVCDCKKIVNVVRLDDVSIVKLDGSRPSFVVGETAFGCSCVIERDEWVSCIEKIVNGKC